ncbi:uncharacterized protein [Antedon mediterranea]|uniref:uncharacterized protein n=1 Tax=Antedon mediterranea TaxID=105859 RepID=UPI003AF5A8EC
MKWWIFFCCFVFLIDFGNSQNVSREFPPQVLEEKYLNSCRNRCQTSSTFSECACDDSCLFYGDCCRDYLYYCGDDYKFKTMESSFKNQLAISADPTKPRWNCVNDPEGIQPSFEGILVVVTCPPIWTIEDIRRKCEEGRLYVATEDLVYDSRGYVYVNQFCAICNMDTAFRSNSTLNINGTFNSLLNTTEFVVEGISAEATQLRQCPLFLDDTCLPNHPDSVVVFGCTAFLEGFLWYKNYMCEQCNAFVIDSREFPPQVIEERIRNSCRNRCQTSSTFVSECACDDLCLFYGDCCRDYLYCCGNDYKFKTMESSFKKQLAISADTTKPRWNCVNDPEGIQPSFEGILVVVTCPPIWTIEDIRRKCEEGRLNVATEDLVYDSRGYVYVNQFCAICNMDTTSSSNSTLNINGTFNSLLNTTEFVVEGIITEAIQLRQCPLFLDDTCLPNHPDSLVVFGCTAFLEGFFSNNGAYKNYMCEQCNILLITSESVWRDDTTNSIIGWSPPIIEIFYLPPKLEIIEVQKCNVNEFYDDSIQRCQNCENGTIITESEYLSAQNALDITLLVDSRDDDGSGYNSVTSREEPRDSNDGRAPSSADTFVCITSCNVIEQDGTENQPTEDDGWITLSTNGSKLSCRILKNDLVNVTTGRLFSYDSTMTVLNILVCVISLIALFVSILTLCCFRSLLNLPGICRLCLMISIFFAQFIMLTIAYITKPRQLCTGTAVVMHFFWLALFSWSNVLAFDLARVFGTQSSRPSTSKKRRLLGLYVLYGWGLPLIIATLSTGLHFSGKFDFSYGGETFCWFSDRHSLLLGFGIPVSICIALNCVLYLITVVGIWKVHRVTEFAVQENQRRNKRKDELKLYIKLSILMGVTWSLVFITVYTDEPVLWYIFIILNGLQGFFIFIAFTCNHQTLAMWRGAYTTHIASHSSSRQLTKSTSV